MKKTMIVLALAAVCAGCCTTRQLDGTNLLHLSHVHRGGGKFERPDNTLETFKWCWQNGSALECDCRMTKDGVGVMLHDRTLKRTARGISPALANKDVSKEVTWAEIKDLDVGSYLRELNPAAADFSHHRIPTIEETFAAMKGNPTYLCFVDEKGAGPEYIARKAREAGVLDQVYYTGQDYQKALDWNKATNGGRTLIWIGTWPRPKHDAKDIARFEAHFEKKMAEMRANGFKGVSAVSLHTYYDPKADEPFVPRVSYLRKIIDEFHAHGIPVCSIPFEGGETEEVYFKLFELGCDGFSTDYPSVMFSVIRKLKAGEIKACPPCEPEAPFAPLTLSAENFDPNGGHIQGLCCSDDAIYLTQMKCLYKFDWSGRLLKKRDVISHTGDMCFWKGEVYTSVAVYGGPNAGKGMIQVFDADLNPVRETLLDRTTDGITVLDGVLYLGMGAKTQPSRTPHRENIVGRFDPISLKPIAERQTIDYGHMTKYGAQAVSTDGRHLYFAFYAGEENGPDFVQFDRDLKPLRAVVCWGANGFDLLPARFGKRTPWFLRAKTLLSPPDAKGKGKVVGCVLDAIQFPDR